MQLHDDSLPVLLGAQKPAFEGYKSIYQIMRKNPNDSFSDFIDRLTFNGLLSPNCPNDAGRQAQPDEARVWLHFSPSECLSTRAEDRAGRLYLSDVLKCPFRPPLQTRPCA
jgi:hypothetical protein